jgi:hypothetical protein
MPSYSQTLTEIAGVQDSHCWNEMVGNWDDYTQDWDYYGELTVYTHRTRIRTLTESLTGSPTIQMILTLHRTFTDAITHSTARVVKVVRTLADSITQTTIFSRVYTAVRELNDWLPLAPDTIIKAIKKLEEISLTFSEAIKKVPSKRISETLNITATFSRIVGYIKNLSDSVALTEYDWEWDKMTLNWDDYTMEWESYGTAFWIRIVTAKLYSDSISLAASIIRRPVKRFTETITNSETIKKIVKLIRNEAVALTTYIQTRANLGWVFADTLTLTENFTKKFREFLKSAIAKISNVILSGRIEQDSVHGRISNSPQNFAHGVSSENKRGKIKNQTITGKIKQT